MSDMGISRLKPSWDRYAKRLCQPPTKQNENNSIALGNGDFYVLPNVIYHLICIMW